MLRLDDHWIWDSWPYTDDDGLHHLFFLKAPRSLPDPDDRHLNPAVGHATSTDYRTWTVLPDALAPAAGPAWDDLAVWTGSVVRGPSGIFHLFYTGASKGDDAKVQRIGRADSRDLIHWKRFGADALLEADPRWYEKYDGEAWGDEAWRDPWVMPDPSGDGWRMLITARANHGDPAARGVVGQAWSPDLEHWEARPPLSEPATFGQLEVLQYIELDDTPHLVFCCDTNELDSTAYPPGQRGGMWLVAGKGLDSVWDIGSARRVRHTGLYAARVVEDVDGTPRLLGFDNGSPETGFLGLILDPVDIDYDE